MQSFAYHFKDLEVLIDNVHTLFETWEDEQVMVPPLDLATLYRTRLAVHEWLSNLLQHADFAGGTPEVSILVQVAPDRVFYTIEDNSTGFEMEHHLKHCAELLEVLPERGFGLQIIRACTQDLSYRRLQMSRQCLAFFVSAMEDPRLDVPLVETRDDMQN